MRPQQGGVVGATVAIATALTGVVIARSDDGSALGAIASTLLVMFIVTLTVGAVQGWRGSAVVDCLPTAVGFTAMMMFMAVADTLTRGRSLVLPVIAVVALGACAGVLYAVGLIIGRTAHPDH